MTPKILIDLDVFTKAVWDKKEGANEFLDAVRSEFSVVTPVAILFYIIRNWRYKKLVDRIFNKMDKLTTFYVGVAQTNLKSVRLTNLPLRILTRRLSRSAQISEEDAGIAVYATINEADFLATYNRRHLKRNEHAIKEFFKNYNLRAPDILVPKN